MTTCDKCGREYEAPEWPFCPHGRGSMTPVGDDIPGGQWFENGFEKPQKFYSHSAHRAALKARGMRINAKWAGEHDRHLKRWDAPSQKTLDDARVLLSRVRKNTQSEPEPEPFPITRTVSDEKFKVLVKR